MMSIREAVNKAGEVRVIIDYPEHAHFGLRGTCVGVIGQLCFVNWDNGTKSKIISTYISIEDPTKN